LAESLAVQCDDLPPSFSRLADLVQKVREKHPVIHPDNVELPKVHGLTYFGEEDSPNKGMESDE
jgi:hypothetical protein